jgi:glycosyltransferase involved in cell wall biosynthesis
MMTDWIWITWEKHRRTRELCRDLGMPLFEWDLDAPRFVKYPVLGLWTLFTLAKTRPKGLLIQNPSIVLALWAILLRPVFRYELAVDAHNAALELSSAVAAPLRVLRQYVQRAADLTIVTNSLLAECVERSGGRPFVLPDRLPDFPSILPQKLRGKQNVVCVSRFAEDEPYVEVIEAATLLVPDITFYMTGNPQKVARTLPQPLPPNLVLTGFVPDSQYLSLLAGADVILDLTNRPDCLVCGAYEAVALGQPLVLSDTPALREYFSQGCIYSDHSPQHIAAAITEALRNIKELRSGIRGLKGKLSSDWQETRGHLVTGLNAMARGQGGC